MSFSIANAQKSPWIYIHYPICQHHCSYCDFNVVARTRSPQDFESVWLSALRTHLVSLKNSPRVRLEGLYLGGGTPSLVSPKTFSELFACLRDLYDWTSETEVTIECNPENLTYEHLASLRDLGVNRPSLGIQTTVPHQLKRLERLSTSKHIFNAVEWLSDLFSNYSLDLMIGIPDQTLESLEVDLDFVRNIRPPHISVYLLTLDDEHKLKTNAYMKSRLANADLASKMYEKVCEALSALGYLHYEVSNFSKP